MICFTLYCAKILLWQILAHESISRHLQYFAALYCKKVSFLLILVWVSFFRSLPSFRQVRLNCSCVCRMCLLLRSRLEFSWDLVRTRIAMKVGWIMTRMRLVFSFCSFFCFCFCFCSFPFIFILICPLSFFLFPFEFSSCLYFSSSFCCLQRIKTLLMNLNLIRFPLRFTLYAYRFIRQIAFAHPDPREEGFFLLQLARVWVWNFINFIWEELRLTWVRWFHGFWFRVISWIVWEFLSFICFPFP